MASELRVVTWVWEKMAELEWHQSTQGGCYTVMNGIVIHISLAGLLLAKGPQQCKIAMPKEVGKIMDAVDETHKTLRNMMMEIRQAACQQIIKQLEDPKTHNDRMRRELFRELSGENL